MILETVVSNAAPQGHNLVLDQVTISAIAVWVIEQAKKYDVPGLRWINANTPQVNRAVAAVAAALSASVLHWTWDPASMSAHFAGVLSVGALFAAGKHWIRSFVWQEILYRGAVRNGEPGPPAAAPPAPVAGPISAVK